MMVVFLIIVLLITIVALTLFIFPVLPLRSGHLMSRNAKLVYIVFVFALFAVVVPTLYDRLGAPMLKDSPLSTRDVLDSETHTADMARVRRLERYLSLNPDDGIVWEHLAQTYRAAGYYDKAAIAYRNAIEWGIPEDISNWHALAETLIQANNGRILGEAQKALENVLRYRPDDPKAIYFLGLARLQHKDPQKALSLWKHLEQTLSGEDPWLTVVRERIARLSAVSKIDPNRIRPADPVPLNK